MVAILTAVVILGVMFKLSVGVYPGFSGVVVQYRWGSGLMLQIGDFDSAAAVVLWTPGTCVPYAILVHNGRVSFQKGQ